jgi:TrkA domain protein
MTEVSESRLPGVGIRYEFTTRAGERVEVVAHRSGRREVYVGSHRDPDTFGLVLELSEGESWTLAELLGGSRVTRELGRLR